MINITTIPSLNIDIDNDYNIYGNPKHMKFTDKITERKKI